MPTRMSYSTLVLARDSTVLTAFLSNDDRWRFPARLAELDPLLISAFIAKEDRWFRWHVGVNPVAMMRAAWNNVVAGRRLSGASTITMQVARLLDPKPRTWLNKAFEVLQAVQLEVHYSKDEILEMYFTLVPYGSNIEGVVAACLMYRGRLPSQLSVAEVATLVVVPNRPTSLRLGGESRALLSARDAWIRRMQSLALIDTLEGFAALSEPLDIARRDTPRNAWHLSVRARREQSNLHVIATTIDATVQARATDVVTTHMRRLRPYGITNAAVIVLDNSSGTVAAYVGSADVKDRAAKGYVDGVRAVRSPGSALKPLVYAMAMDAGFLTPNSMLEDVPIDIDGYAPENFDKRFRGAVSMEEALATSLNVPAVSTLHRLGVDAMTASLKSMNFRSITTTSDVGLSLVLGGCGVTLEQLAGMYSAIARGGRWIPTRYLKTSVGEKSTGVPVLSTGSAWAISDILSRHERPDLFAGIDVASRLPSIAWKTGTSYGRRDAWSIGYNGRYTVAVWVGNFDGSGNAFLTGSSCATPILFDIVRTLEGDTEGDKWLARPADVDVRLVCSSTGLLPGDSCTAQVVDIYLPERTATQRCTHRSSFFVNAARTTSFCTSCVPQDGTVRSEWYTTLTPALQLHHRTHGISYTPPPPHNPACTRLEDGKLMITSPSASKEILLERNTDTHIKLTAVSAADAYTLYWFVNGAFAVSSAPGKSSFIPPLDGTNEITCIDDRGRTASTTIKVSYW